MLHENASVTALEHRILATLEPAPFSDLCAEDYHGNTEFYSFDVFRRLYNDAVESMQFYEQLAEGYCNAADMYRAQCENLEKHLMEYAQESCDD